MEYSLEQGILAYKTGSSLFALELLLSIVCFESRCPNAGYPVGIGNAGVPEGFVNGISLEAFMALIYPRSDHG
jgi:hypothetical protein